MSGTKRSFAGVSWRGQLLAPSVLAGSLLVAQGPATAAPRAGQDEAEEFQSWVHDNAIRLDSFDWSRTDPACFAFLDQALEGKRVVYLGETDHFVAERMEFRLLLIRELARRGFRRIGFEMGLSDAKRMDKYLKIGDERWLDRVALYGFKGNLREDRKDEVPGWTDDSHPEFTKTILDEARWFLTELRKMNEELPADEPRLKWFGWDLSFRPGGGYVDAAALLRPHQDHAVVQELQGRMARVPGETRLEEADRLEATIERIDQERAKLVPLLGETGTLEVRRCLSRMADSFRLIDEFQDLRNFDLAKIRAALAHRETRMAHNFDEYLAEWPPDEKFIVLGHALHLSKDSENLVTQDHGNMWEAIGTHLERKLPGQVYGMWLLHNRGMHGQPHAVPPVQPFRSPRDSVERVLAQVHPMLMLPLDAGDPPAWLRQERVFSHSGAPARAVLPDQVDCLFFVDVAHPPGERPVQ